MNKMTEFAQDGRTGRKTEVMSGDYQVRAINGKRDIIANTTLHNPSAQTLGEMLLELCEDLNVAHIRIDPIN